MGHLGLGFRFAYRAHTMPMPCVGVSDVTPQEGGRGGAMCVISQAG